MAAFQFLTKENIWRRFEQSKIYTDSLTTRFPEWQRIASNKPKEGMPEHLPKNTDGTTASVTRKTPRRVVQQLPSGHIEGPEEEWLKIVSQYILNEEIIQNANTDYNLLEKEWQQTEGCLIRGFSCWYCPLVRNGEYIGPDKTLPYWGDVFVQPGKLSDRSSRYVFLRSWWREEDIEELIDRVSGMDKNEATESGWDVEVLKEIKTLEQSKDDKATTPTERYQNANQRGGIEMITGFQRGVGGQFLTFHREAHKIARTKDNKDPRGDIPLGFMYCETDGTNPFGRGFVEMVAPLQNLIDSDDQMYQFNRALMLGPPVKKRGSYSKTQLQLVPNAIWDMGTNPQNDAEPVQIDSKALENYPQLYQLNQSRIFQLLSAPTSQVAAGNGPQNTSKTPQGVAQTNQVLTVDDNFIRKKYEAAFQAWAECAINLWFAEKTGVEELQLDLDTANTLRNLKDFDPNMLSPDNKIRINYDDETKALKFKVNPGTSKKQDDAEQLQIYQEGAKLISPQFVWFLGQDGWKFDTGQYYRNMFTHMHIQDIDKVITKMTDEEAQQAKQAPFPIIDPPQIRLQGKVPPGAMQAALARGGVNLDPQTQNLDVSPVDLDKIYNDPTTPATVKAQIMQIAGLQPDQMALEDAQHTEAAQHMANQATGLGTAADTVMGQERPQDIPPANNPDAQQQTQPDKQKPDSNKGDKTPPTLTPDDQVIAAHMKAAGVPDDKITQGLALLNTGAPAEDVLAHVTRKKSSNAGR